PHLEYLGRRPEARVRVALARCQDQLGREAEAAATVGAVLKRQPDYAPALIERGRLALKAGRLADAERWLRRGCELEPGDYQARYHLQQCLHRLGKAAEGRAELARLKQTEDDIGRLREIIDKQMERAPHDPSLHHEVGAILLRGGAAAEGLRWLHQALKDDPRHAPTHQALADYYQRVGEFG